MNLILRPTDIKQSYVPELFGDSQIKLGPEDISKRMEKELREFRYILASPESHHTTDLDRRFFYLDASNEAFGELTNGLRFEKEQLAKLDRTTETMTIDDWRRHQPPLALILVVFLKFMFLDGLQHKKDDFDIYEYVEREDDPGLFADRPPSSSSKEEQFVQFLYCLLDASPSLHVYDIWMSEYTINQEQQFLLLDASSIYLAELLLVELILQSSFVCSTITQMKEWVKDRIAERDICLAPHDAFDAAAHKVAQECVESASR